MRFLFTFLIFIFYSFLNPLLTLGQEGSGVLIQPITQGCGVGCCDPTTSGSQASTISVTRNIPAYTNATLTVGHNMCGTSCAGGTNWEASDNIAASTFGVSLVGASGGTCTPSGTSSGCRSTGSTGTTVTITLTSNRLDEQATWNLSFSTYDPINETPSCALLTPLPIKVKSFDVVKTNSTSKLILTTASETNNDFFTIERSLDGVEFDAIGEIKGAGNSSSELKYEFIDEYPLPGINYYRVKQTDFDGKYSYTEIKSVRHQLGNITVSPLRTNGRLQITSTQNNYDVALYNAAGQEVFRKNTLNGDQTIDIEPLEAGIYFVKIVDQTFKILKY